MLSQQSEDSDSCEETGEALVYLNELHVLMDAISGSLRIADGAGIWVYNRDTREKTVNIILERMGRIPLSVKRPPVPKCEKHAR